jgi:hypothetical protein
VAKEMAIKKGMLLKSYFDFQKDIRNVTYPNYKDQTKILIPQVSLRDEVTTIGYGMAIIEVLVMIGILIEEKNDNQVTRWTLSNDYEHKRLYLCMDGLSLDCHRSFKNKLFRIKQSFSQNYVQATVFQKALDCVVETSGPLHVAFHMLQTIC